MSQSPSNVPALLQELRQYGGKVRTTGLSDAQIERMAAGHPELGEAALAALALHRELRADFDDLLRADEDEQVRRAQAGFVNFYAADAVNPYIALTARGPWIITLKGAVLHDSGGYGMLGGGHTPAAVLAAMARPQAMANIMTPSLSHLRFEQAMRREIGQRRDDGCPYARFMCLNSGSEAVTLAGRIADINAKLHTDPGGRHAGKTIKRVAIKGGFHGRTEHPARYSDSTRKAYLEHLASFRGNELIAIEPYDIEQLRQVFAEADTHGWFIEAVFLEPVMGEGDPGRALPPAFYAAARELTAAHGSLLLVDSIQAGLRVHGVLSVVDYPGFESLPAPDMETYSKALNAGQFPMSALAVTEHAAGLYRKGTYGNTMTANPRAMDVACAVLESLTPALRANIVQRGKQFLDRLNALKNELPGLITKVQGTGLLFSAELSEDFLCYGAGSTEEFLREQGFGVIHGGARSLRFTPHFGIDDDEIDLLIEGLRHALLNGPRRSQQAAA
ncbi:MAG: aminotransferase class III-fold pyridoxal phosphate-dependent enzyme [Lysobacteraceae bacterium]